MIDRYPEVSIKNAGRQHRAASGSQKIHISKPDQPIPKLWKKYLAHGYNKKNLVNFFFETWKKADVAALKGVTVFFIHGEHCHSITPLSGSVIVQEIAQLTNFSALVRVYKKCGQIIQILLCHWEYEQVEQQHRQNQY